MAKLIAPVVPALPATTAIQDPATRRFAQAVEQAITAIRSASGALSILEEAAGELAANPGGTPPAIADWLFKSELYWKLRGEIERVDVATKQRIIDETLALAQEYDPAAAYLKNELVRFNGSFYRATANTTPGQAPTNTAYWVAVGAYASLGDAIALLVENERTVSATELETVATSVSSLASRMGAAEVGIVDEQSARATNDSALMSAINTAWSITGATNALVQNGSRIQTNWTAAQADKWNQLQVEVFGAGGKTIRAALAEEATLRANADGTLYGQYTVKIDTGGYVAGFGLASESSQAGANTSAFVIRADKFAIVMPGYGEHVPFAIGPSGASFTGATDWGNVQGKSGFAAIDQITESNVTTYIANGAIGAAQIGSINLVGNFNVRSATAGARMEMDSRAIKVFDANGVKRVQMGNLSV